MKLGWPIDSIMVRSLKYVFLFVNNIIETVFSSKDFTLCSVAEACSQAHCLFFNSVYL